MRISDWSSDVCSSDLSDNIPPGKKRFQSFQRRLIVGLAVNRHYYGCIANVEVHIAGGNNLPVAPHQTGGGHGNDVQAKGTRPRLASASIAALGSSSPEGPGMDSRVSPTKRTT